MKKTQTINKTSFRGLVDLQQQKLPQKKSRSRSIRDRNNTTNQFSHSRATQNYSRATQTYSRATQHNQKGLQNNIQVNDNRIRQTTWTAGQYNRNNNQEQIKNVNNKRKQSKQGIIKFQDNLSNITSNISKNFEQNLSKNEGQFSKIRQNMRKESQQLRQKRQRSKSNRRNRSNRSKQNSRQSRANRFPNSIVKQSNQALNEQQLSNELLNQKQLLNQITNIKNQYTKLQQTYSLLNRNISSNNKQNKQILLNSSIRSSLIQEQQKQLKEKAQDLNNILQTFDITFKQNITKTNKMINQKIQNYLTNKSQIKENQYDAENNRKVNFNEQTDSNEINLVFQNIQRQFGIGLKHQTTNNNQPSLFQQMKSKMNKNFSDFQKKLILAEQRLLQ